MQRKLEVLQFQWYGKVSCLYDHHQNSFKNSDQNSQEKQIYQNIGFILQFQSLFRYRESDPKSRNWLELPINPPDARKLKSIIWLPVPSMNFKLLEKTNSETACTVPLLKLKPKVSTLITKNLKRQFHIPYHYWSPLSAKISLHLYNFCYWNQFSLSDFLAKNGLQ